ncbi:MAG TPA: hypothetical protein VFR53_09695 [Methylomirabilota bacterium]|nr:hypothetical protein [Methylomirabilota bacterium]
MNLFRVSTVLRVLSGSGLALALLAGSALAQSAARPDVKVIVRSVSHNPYLGTSTVELVKFQLRP